MAAIARQAGRPSLMQTSRTPKAWPRPRVRWFCNHVPTHFVAGRPAGTDGSQPKAARVELAVLTLVVLTASVVAWVSPWWVPAYLTLMVLIFVTPRRRRRLVLPREPAQVPADVIAGDLANELRAIPAAEGELIPHAVNWTSVHSADESIRELAGFHTELTVSGATKPRRSRSRARKMARPAVGPLPESSSAKWIRVGPGKFVRADDQIHTVSEAHAEERIAVLKPLTDLSADAIPAMTELSVSEQGQRPFEPPGLTLDNEGIENASVDLARQSVAKEHGITPSTFGPVNAAITSVDGLEDDVFGVVGESTADSNDAAHLEIIPSRHAVDSRHRGLPGRTSRDRGGLVSHRIVNAIRRGGRVPPRSIVRSGPTCRGLRRSSFVPNTCFREAACRAFGRVSHIERTLRPRSPPGG